MSKASVRTCKYCGELTDNINNGYCSAHTRMNTANRQRKREGLVLIKPDDKHECIHCNKLYNWVELISDSRGVSALRLCISCASKLELEYKRYCRVCHTIMDLKTSTSKCPTCKRNTPISHGITKAPRRPRDVDTSAFTQQEKYNPEYIKQWCKDNKTVRTLPTSIEEYIT